MSWSASAPKAFTVFTTPFPVGEINGPEVHANLIDAMLADRSIARAPAWVGVVLVAAGAAIVGVAGWFLNMAHTAPWRWRWPQGYS